MNVLKLKWRSVGTIAFLFFFRPKLRRSGLSKEYFRGFGHCSIYLVRYVGVSVRVNTTWQLGSTRRQSQLRFHHMYVNSLELGYISLTLNLFMINEPHLYTQYIYSLIVSVTEFKVFFCF